MNLLGALLTNNKKIDHFGKMVAEAREELSKITRDAPPSLTPAIYKRLLKASMYARQ